MPLKIASKMIAPCGMNCAVCYAHLRKKNKCLGCNMDNESKPNYCRKCKIKNCAKKNKFCFECDEFPCKSIKNMDKRYKTRYGMSMIENLEEIKKNGIRKYVKDETIKWDCPKCGQTICVHYEKCMHCGKTRKKKVYVLNSKRQTKTKS